MVLFLGEFPALASDCGRKKKNTSSAWKPFSPKWNRKSHTADFCSRKLCCVFLCHFFFLLLDSFVCLHICCSSLYHNHKKFFFFFPSKTFRNLKIVILLQPRAASLKTAQTPIYFGSYLQSQAWKSIWAETPDTLLGGWLMEDVLELRGRWKMIPATQDDIPPILKMTSRFCHF